MDLFIAKYFENFFTQPEKILFNLHINDHKYTNNINWEEAEAEYIKILKNEGMVGFKMVVAKDASYFIHNLFQKHVTDNTFVISTLPHSAVIEELNNIQNKYILTYDDVKTINISKLIQYYKESNCNELFIYLSSLIEQNLLLQSFCYKLKEELTKQNISHTIVLDDVATMFLIPKDYTIFDYVLFTCHSLIPTFDSGILFYKDPVDFGFEDYEIAKAYLIPLTMILTKKDKILLFNFMLHQYFIEELQSLLFILPEDPAPNMFCIKVKDNLKRHLIRYAEELSDYNINCSDCNIIIRCNHFISQGTVKALEGLNKLKAVLQKCIKINSLQ